MVYVFLKTMFDHIQLCICVCKEHLQISGSPLTYCIFELIAVSNAVGSKEDLACNAAQSLSG